MEMIILLCVIAYILGSIPSGLWIGKIFYKKDIRDFGSG
ncbi:glycerol-3-phosphate 1-O-acyltransferase PlsY, partial [Listeria seeligeri]